MATHPANLTFVDEPGLTGGKTLQLIDHDKDVLAVHDVPIAALPVPISVFVGVPIGIAPIVIGVHRGPVCSLHRSPAATMHYSLGVRGAE
jgi:hypothetical protein